MKAGIDYPGVSVVFFCHDGEGNFLFHKRSTQCRDQHGRWDCGGGGIEVGETIEEALFRELKEEYGCTGTIDATLAPHTCFIDSHGTTAHWIAHPFIVRVQKDNVIISEPEMIDEHGWFPIDNLPEPLHDGVKKDIALYIDTLRTYSL